MFTQRESRPGEQRINPMMPLSGLVVALSEIAQLTQSLAPSRCLGLLDFAVLPDPALLRLAPEADRQLREEVTRRLSEAIRPQDRLYSAEHWEWLIVLDDLPSSVPLMMAMMRLDTLFADTLPGFGGSHLQLRIACGGALYPDDGQDPRHLVQSSRIAALAADRTDSRYAAYDPAMEQADAAQLQLHAELPRALASGGGLAIHMQAQIDLNNGQCVSAEALLRWQLPGGDKIVPSHTLATVERLGLRSKFTRWLVQQAMQTQTRLQAEGIFVQLSVNLSAHDLLDAELPDLIQQTLSTWDLASECLLFELTETLMIEDTEQVMEVLHRLRNMGFHLSVDDFGTGYASMSYLQRLPVQEVKIDQSFIRYAESSERDREIIASLVQLAHRLDMRVVAEGIETPETAAIVTQLGCDRGQGFYYSKALPVDEFIAWWRSKNS